MASAGLPQQLLNALVQQLLGFSLSSETLSLCLKLSHSGSLWENELCLPGSPAHLRCSMMFIFQPYVWCNALPSAANLLLPFSSPPHFPASCAPAKLVAHALPVKNKPQRLKCHVSCEVSCLELLFVSLLLVRIGARGKHNAQQL